MVVFCTHGITDPLVASLMLDYVLRMQAAAADRDVLLFTEEPPGATEPAGLKERLTRASIVWVPLRYDVKGAQWSQKIRSLCRMYRRVCAFRRKHSDPWLVGFLVYGGAYAVLMKRIGLGRSASVCFEPHSRYMVELGVWGRRSLKSLTIGWLERMQARHADVVLAPTSAVHAEVMKHAPRGRVLQQAITIDVGSARFDADARERVREVHGLQQSTVLVYAGKFGGIYYSTSAYLRFIALTTAVDATLRFLIISAKDDLDAIRRDPLYSEVAHHLVLHGPVPSTELRDLLSASDFGVVSVPPTPSQAFRTPVKTAHYWAAGLPLIIPEGVSDDWRIARDERLGIVVSGLPDLDPAAFQRAMEDFLSEDREELRTRCIDAARRYRDTGKMVQLLNDILT